ncbi:MAG: 30S ribosomal protein S8 [Candidatus Mcinerneyibacterium aminivorans]|uniref:Small ribosomal subunit protein uS8 n=1 Tax=Candidatus Mcinerneyibacterium aminivorans TaxID=2703815 RepID=A0A5D0MJE2_9BACT|nr:MAG: 30S ribosomal protein S8 [Candidatus Mcinerneyibacterium aminivorans]
MVMTDTIADMLTRIRNGFKAKHEFVTVPVSNFKKSILDLLEKEGYIDGYQEIDAKDGNYKLLNIKLKYFGNERNKKSVIQGIEKVSKPGLKKYVKKDEMPRVKDGLGIAIVSTSKGIMTEKQARKYGVGGEIICYVY